MKVKRESKLDRRSRRSERPSTPPHLLLWARLAGEVDDAMLKEIAEADYGMDSDEHLAELVRLREVPSISSPLEWHPTEVLELTRWEKFRDPKWKPRAAGVRGHLMRAFSCMALLLSADQESGGTAEHGEVDTLARLVDSAIQLGSDYEKLLLPFLSWRIDRLPDCIEEPPFFHFARLVLTIPNEQSPNPRAVVDLVRELVAEEHRVRTSTWALMPKADGPWLLGLTFSHQSHHYWRSFASELGEVAEQKLSGQARTEVRQVALRVGT